jgi:NAD(P)-dependent dehydrogenase (short-subunit alcohol dehydrogenase family)
MLAKDWGRVIFISSESAIMTPGEMVHYGMTKTAQLAISRGMAEQTKGTRVTVNTVLPGPTRSEGIVGFLQNLASTPNATPEQAEKEFFEKYRGSSLLQRLIEVRSRGLRCQPSLLGYKRRSSTSRGWSASLHCVKVYGQRSTSMSPRRNYV